MLGVFFGLLLDVFPWWLRAGIFLYGVGMWVLARSSFPVDCVRDGTVPLWRYALIVFLSGGGAALLLFLLSLRV